MEKRRLFLQLARELASWRIALRDLQLALGIAGVCKPIHSPARWPRERCRAWTCSRTWGEDLSPGVAQSRSCAL